MPEIQGEVEKVVSNPDKSEIIRESHKKRRALLQAIQQADIETAEKLSKEIFDIIEEDTIDIMKRIEGNTLRSYKNFMLSHNSMYALVAEMGGLDPVLAHYMSEKYAIIIESSSTIKNLAGLHNQVLKDYSSPENRITLDDKKSLSAKVLYYVSAHFMNPLDVQHIAKELYVTREHLMRTFKKETGTTINETIKEKRLFESKLLLKQSKLSITDIAVMVGFNSSQYFSKVFKETYGVSPTQYQKPEDEIEKAET